MKIIRIIARLNIGGPAIHTILLSKNLNNENYQSILLTGTPGKTEGDMGYFAEENNVKPLIITELSRNLNWKDDIIAFWKILKIFYREKPNIVHTHTAKAGTLGRIAAILYNITFGFFFSPSAIYHTFHGHVFHSYFSKRKTTIFIFIEKILAKFSKAIIVISEKQKEDITKVFKISYEKKVKLIPLGFELSSFINNKLVESNFKKKLSLFCDNESIKKPVFVGIVGRLVKVKNHKMFIDAAVRLCKQYTNLCFVVVGDGELKEDLFKYTVELKINKRFFFTGWRKDLPAVYKTLDIIALTSFNEGTPVSLIEAMASEKPIIATDVGGVEDLFIIKKNTPYTNGFKLAENGILVEKNNTDSFINGLKLLILEKKMREAMGLKGKEFVKQKFSITRLTKDIERLYKVKLN